MNKSLEVLKAIYKPYRYTIMGKATMLETTSGDFIIKEEKKNIKELFSYLKSRDFYSFPKLIDGSRKDVNVYSYIEDTPMPNEQKLLDLTDVVSTLHNNTSYYKEVSEDKYKSIYENIQDNINYLKSYYQTKYDIYFNEVYMSPSHYLFMRNYYKVVQALDFCESELNNWYDLVKDNKSIRVSVVHNNLKLDHYIKSDKDYLISWDNYILDTPVLDIVNLYKNEYKYYNFEAVLKRYFNNYPLLDYEQKLLFILLVLPPIIKEDSNEFKNTEIMQENFDYIFKTEELIRPYYAHNKEKEQE